MDKDVVYIYYGTVVVVQSLREIIKGSHSLVSDSLRPHGLYPTGLLHPWNFLGKSTGVGFYAYLQEIFQPRDQAQVSHIADGFFTISTTREAPHCQMQFSSVQFSHSIMSDSLQPHEPQHGMPPCPSPTPGVNPNPCLLSQ